MTDFCLIKFQIVPWMQFILRDDDKMYLSGNQVIT